MSTSNNQEANTVMISLSQASNNELTGSKEQQRVKNTLIVNRNSWADQVEDEDEDYAEIFLAASEDKAAQFSVTPHTNDRVTKMQNEQVSNSTDIVPKKSSLGSNATVFVPFRQQQKDNNSADSNEIQNSSTNKAVATGINTSIFATYNFTPTNILHAFVTHDMDSLRDLGNLRTDKGTLVSGFNPTENFGVDMAQIFFEEG